MRRRRSRIEAERLVLEFKQSGLTRQAFCAQHGLSVAALDKYRRRPAITPPGRERLLPVELVSNQTSAVKTLSNLWVELVGGRRIGVEIGFDAITLDRLISLLDKLDKLDRA